MTEPRHSVDSITSDALDQLYDQLERADLELRRYTEGDSADAAAGSYAGRVEDVERQLRESRWRTKDAERRVRVQRERAGHAEVALARVQQAVTNLHTDAASARQAGHETAAYVLEGSARRINLALEETAQPEPAVDRQTAVVLAALHPSAEADVSRVIALYERWVKAGPPPIGTSMSRWWDQRLIELRDAIHPKEQ